MLYAVAGVKFNFTHLHEVTIRGIFPLLDKTLTQHSLGQITQAFGLILLSQIKDFTRDHTGPISLTELTNEPLFTAATSFFFGSAFPTDIYRLPDPQQKCALSFLRNVAVALAVLRSTDAATEVLPGLFAAMGGHRYR